MKLQILISSLMVLALATSCGSDSSGGGGGSTNGLVGTVSTVLSQANKVSGVLDTAKSNELITTENLVADEYLMTAWWDTTTGLPHPTDSTAPSVTPKDWMGAQLDPDAVTVDNGSAVNVFGRLKTALGIFCALGIAAESAGQAIDSNGYLSAGTFSITFTADNVATMLSTCGIDASGNVGASVSITVDVETGTYERSYTFDAPLSQVYYVKNSGGEVNIATGETGSYKSRTVVSMNQNTGILKVEYVGDGGNRYGYRLYYDEGSDEGHVLTYEDGTRYRLAGKPNTGDAFSISLKSSSVASEVVKEGCVASATGDLLVDGSRCTASGTRLAGSSVNSLDSFFTAFAGTSGTDWGTVSDSTAISWTNETNMSTVAFAP
jgi:hypothetical protein